ncbi:hypothetical protein VB620_06385 [Nodularia harveyana UHCC-0300]|uniref:DUF4203 domain-containing protein n=1 Tax=Nodularia harveyana UHCC-0300 TaxID=2974287 RepID=A0ABU5UBQ4_9CYAN|nr:hypothetical protein [Nodularia harveyana]MEA5580967.1 hypothetical protein [Nodularia harveyana UHCC-0300]
MGSRKFILATIIILINWTVGLSIGIFFYYISYMGFKELSPSSRIIANLSYGFIAGIIGGLGTGIGVKLFKSVTTYLQVFLTIVIWASAFVLGFGIAINPNYLILGFCISGILGGIFMGLMSQRIKPTLTYQDVSIIAIFWTMGIGLSALIVSLSPRLLYLVGLPPALLSSSMMFYYLSHKD